MAQDYNPGPYNCGKYQADIWDEDCQGVEPLPPEIWLPRPGCPETEWTEPAKPSPVWIPKEC